MKRLLLILGDTNLTTTYWLMDGCWVISTHPVFLIWENDFFSGNDVIQLRIIAFFFK